MISAKTAPGNGVAARISRLTEGKRGAWARILGLGLLMVLLLGASVAFTGSLAHADEDKDEKNYSLYALASNAGAYFGNANSPDNDDCNDQGDRSCMPNWRGVTENSPGSAGSLMGYVDDDFSFSLQWFYSAVSGSSKTVGYDSFEATNDNNQRIGTLDGMLAYAHFGAANQALGFDSMDGGAGSGIIHALGGSIVWLLFILAMGISWLFGIIIKILQLLNPFLWFYNGVKAVSPDWAQGMVTGANAQGQDVTTIIGSGDARSGLVNMVTKWYSVLLDMSWTVIVPLMIGLFIVSLVFLKNGSRGSLFKKIVVRLLFIGVGLPLIGGMYTSALNQFDDSFGQSAGPSRVVLSTYVDFNKWATSERLAIPESASISWNAKSGAPNGESLLNARNSALAINVKSNSTFESLSSVVAPNGSNANDVWSNTDNKVSKNGDSRKSVAATLDILNRYISGQTTKASDFETGIKSSIMDIPNNQVKQERKRDWFIGKSYEKSKEFGEKGKPVDPVDHPVISVRGGLTSTDNGGNSKTFSSNNVDSRCGYKVVGANGNPANCNLSPLAMFNYLNTSFDSHSMTTYSSNKATSGFTRESHASVSQVGAGPSAFMYWANSVVLLGSLVLLGLFYGVGMLVGALKRTISLMASIVPATLGSIAGIAKVVIYGVALVLEVMVTVFIYQFVAELLIELPSLIEGPIGVLVTNTESVFSGNVLGSAAVLVMTFLSICIIIGVTFILLRVRRSVLDALDEMVTKFIDKFLETNTPPTPSGGGAMAGLARGAGAGAGMAATNKMMDKINGGNGGKSQNKATQGGTNGAKTRGTNVGGTNGPRQPALAGVGSRGELEGGSDGRDGIDGGPNSPTGPNAPITDGGGSGAYALEGGQGYAGVDGARGTQGTNAAGLGQDGTSGRDGSNGALGGVSRADRDKQLARQVAENGGLPDRGVNLTGKPQPRHGVAGAAGVGAIGAVGSGGRHGSAGQQGSDAQGLDGRQGQNGQGAASSAGARGTNGSDARGLRPGERRAVSAPNAPTNLAGTAGANGANVGRGADGTVGASGAAGVVSSKGGRSAISAGAAGAAGAHGQHGQSGAQSVGSQAGKNSKASQTHVSTSNAGTPGSATAASAKPGVGKSAKASATPAKGLQAKPTTGKPTAGKVVGGAVKGAAAGAATGFQAGKFVPGVGTAVATGGGAVIGGAAGARAAAKGTDPKAAAQGKRHKPVPAGTAQRAVSAQRNAQVTSKTRQAVQSASAQAQNRPATQVQASKKQAPAAQVQRPVQNQAAPGVRATQAKTPGTQVPRQSTQGGSPAKNAGSRAQAPGQGRRVASAPQATTQKAPAPKQAQQVAPSVKQSKPKVEAARRSTPVKPVVSQPQAPRVQPAPQPSRSAQAAQPVVQQPQSRREARALQGQPNQRASQDAVRNRPVATGRKAQKPDASDES